LIFQCFFWSFGIQHWFSIHLVALVAWSSPKYRGVGKCHDGFFPANRSRAPFVGLERVDPSPPVHGPVLEGYVDDEERSAPSWQLKVPVPVTSVGCGSNFCGRFGFYDVASLSAFQVWCSQHVWTLVAHYLFHFLWINYGKPLLSCCCTWLQLLIN
jgi:hypothetical protein